MTAQQREEQPSQLPIDCQPSKMQTRCESLSLSPPSLPYSLTHQTSVISLRMAVSVNLGRIMSYCHYGEITTAMSNCKPSNKINNCPLVTHSCTTSHYSFAIYHTTTPLFSYQALGFPSNNRSILPPRFLSFNSQQNKSKRSKNNLPT